MILLRLATESDRTLVMCWRNLTYQGSFYSQKHMLTWEEHKAWWASRNQDWREFIIEVLDNDYEMRPVGMVTIGQLDHWSPEIGYAIGSSTDWGKGYGKEAVRLALEWLKNHGKEYCHTTVLQTNFRSANLLKNLGFEVLGGAREGEVWMQKKLD